MAKKYMAKLEHDKRKGGYVFNRWTKEGTPLKSMMVSGTKSESIREIRKKHTLLKRNR